jgi:hypothetical protein
MLLSNPNIFIRRELEIYYRVKICKIIENIHTNHISNITSTFNPMTSIADQLKEFIQQDKDEAIEFVKKEKYNHKRQQISSQLSNFEKNSNNFQEIYNYFINNYAFSTNDEANMKLKEFVEIKEYFQKNYEEGNPFSKSSSSKIKFLSFEFINLNLSVDFEIIEKFENRKNQISSENQSIQETDEKGEIRKIFKMHKIHVLIIKVT